MHFQFDVAPPSAASPPTPPPPPASENTELLRQLLDVQREQLGLLRASAAAQDAGSRWRAFLARWQADFPDLPAACKHALPALEHAYVRLIADLADHLRSHGGDGLDNEFTLNEFLDRYGMRLGQLGTILSLIGPLAEAAKNDE